MTTTQQNKLRSLGYKVVQNRHKQWQVFKDGYRQHKTVYCTADMARGILDKCKEKQSNDDN